MMLGIRKLFRGRAPDCRLGLYVLCCIFVFPLKAEELPPPQDRLVLMVSGNIGHTTNGQSALFDRTQLENIGMRNLRTTTPWTDGEINFEGVLLSDLLDVVASRGEQLHAAALNDYSVTIPVGDAKDCNVLIALKADGEYLSLRNRGPLWVIYPWVDKSELDKSTLRERSIWHLHSIIVE